VATWQISGSPQLAWTATAPRLASVKAVYWPYYTATYQGATVWWSAQPQLAWRAGRPLLDTTG
jgi:hypothetical protein